VWAGKDRTAATLRQFFDDLAPGPGGGADPPQRRWGGMDPHRGHRACPESRAVPGCLSCRGLGHQGPRRAPPVTGHRVRRTGHPDQATTIKAPRWALLKNPPDRTGEQRTTLAAIAKDNGALYRAYLLKEQLRMIFQAELPEARALLAGVDFLGPPQPHPRLRPTRQDHHPLPGPDPQRRRARAVQRQIRSHQHTHLRLLTRRAYGYHSPDSLIAMADLTRGGLCPPLPGRP
jgi:transposase